jgi:hypothetical protein
MWLGLDPWTALSYIIPGTDKDLHSYKEYCESLGEVSVFKCKDDVNVLDMSLVSNVKHLKGTNSSL